MGTRLVALALLCACGHHHDGGDGDAGLTFSAIHVKPDAATLVVPLGGTATQDYTVLGTDSTRRARHHGELHARRSTATFGTFANATLTAVAARRHDAGHRDLRREHRERDAARSTSTGTRSSAPRADQLRSAVRHRDARHDAANTPAIEYPIDQAVAPLNIPAIEIQYTTASNDLFHIHLASTYASLDVYTTDPQNTFSDADWIAIANTAVGDKLVITVEGLVQAAPATKYASTPVTFNLSHDTIDTSAIYWWASSQGSDHEPDVRPDHGADRREGQLQRLPLAVARRLAHRLQPVRRGRRADGEYVGFMHYDDQAKTWNEVVNADNKAIPGTYTTFAPLGNPFPDDTQSVALVTSMSGTFSLYDPDTGARGARRTSRAVDAGRRATRRRCRTGRPTATRSCSPRRRSPASRSTSPAARSR